MSDNITMTAAVFIGGQMQIDSATFQPGEKPELVYGQMRIALSEKEAQQIADADGVLAVVINQTDHWFLAEHLTGTNGGKLLFEHVDEAAMNYQLVFFSLGARSWLQVPSQLGMLRVSKPNGGEPEFELSEPVKISMLAVEQPDHGEYALSAGEMDQVLLYKRESDLWFYDPEGGEFEKICWQKGVEPFDISNPGEGLWLMALYVDEGVKPKTIYSSEGVGIFSSGSNSSFLFFTISGEDEVLGAQSKRNKHWFRLTGLGGESPECDATVGEDQG